MGNKKDNNVMEKVIHKNLEPGIINDEMITNEVLAGYKGEAGRLARLEAVDLTIVTVLRLEFQSTKIYYNFEQFLISIRFQRYSRSITFGSCQT